MQTQICLIQEPWFFRGQVGGINSLDSQLVYHKGGLRPRTAIFIKEVQSNMVPGFTTRDLVAMQIKCGETKKQKDKVVYLAYFLSDSREMPPPTEFKKR